MKVSWQQMGRQRSSATALRRGESVFEAEARPVRRAHIYPLMLLPMAFVIRPGGEAASAGTLPDKEHQSDD